MNTIYILLVFAHVGVMGKGNSNAVTTQEFLSKESCHEASKAFEELASGSVKVITTKCVKK